MELTGRGLYTYKEASRLTGIKSAELRRWLRGQRYKTRRGKAVNHTVRLWKPELEDFDINGLSFHDLLEVRFVKRFRQHGVSLQTIRVAAKNARELLDTAYPFTSRKFQTDGKSIFSEALHETGEVDLLDLKTRQLVFRSIVGPSLYKGIEFGDDDLAARWYPLDRKRDVVLDPNISFGKPIVTDYGVRTDIIYDAYIAEGKDERLVANLYDLPLKAIQSAINFETHMAA